MLSANEQTNVEQLCDFPGRALLVDLNNFSTFPTLAIGLLVATLRNAAWQVDVLCPLEFDVPAAEREYPETKIDDLIRRLHLSTAPMVRPIRDLARSAHWAWGNRTRSKVIREVAAKLDQRPDVLLLSAYLQHYDTVVALAAQARERNIPVLLGGPVFNFENTVDAWRGIPGLTAIVGSEVDFSLPNILATLRRGGDLLQFPGVTLPDGRRSSPAAPLRGLDDLPVPDFSDFPWHRYRFRVVPVMATRGCQWDKCTFCSDVASVSGRTFRTRSVDAVLGELREQARVNETNNFLFIDLKLNSNPGLFRGLTENIQREVPGAQWVGTVHVDLRRDNGLSRQDLKKAAASGMRRVSFGLESGSQRLLDLMRKGSSIEKNEQFIRDAHAAGISVRCTMIKGYPGETAEDMELTAAFLERNEAYIDRLRYNEFSLHESTPVYRDIASGRGPANLSIKNWDYRKGRAQYVNPDGFGKAYRKAKSRVLANVHEINRKPLRGSARAFDGLM